MEGSNAKIVDGQAPGCKGASERSNAGVFLPEIVAEAILCFFDLALGLSFDVIGTVLHVVGFVEAKVSLCLHGSKLFL